jgi:hypothetical protein
LLWRWFAPLLRSELHSGNAFFFLQCQWHSCGLNRVIVSYRWLYKHCRFLLLFMLDGHNGTVHTSSASCSSGGYLSTSTPVVQNPTDGHVDTVGVANGHLDAVGYVLVVCREWPQWHCPLPLPVDGHHDSVDCSCDCHGWPQWHCPLMFLLGSMLPWTSNLISWLVQFNSMSRPSAVFAGLFSYLRWYSAPIYRSCAPVLLSALLALSVVEAMPL